MEKLSDNLLTRLLTADIVCKSCGDRYGKYSVGCSSSWHGSCQVCGEFKPVTEVRDWGYLTKGINEEKAKIKGQSADVAKHMEEIENEPASYEQGEITCKFTEEEVAYLNHYLYIISENLDDPEDVPLFESVGKKITELYEDHCARYEFSPTLLAYHAKYGTWGIDSPEDEARWNGFVTAYNLLNNND